MVRPAEVLGHRLALLRPRVERRVGVAVSHLSTPSSSPCMHLSRVLAVSPTNLSPHLHRGWWTGVVVEATVNDMVSLVEARMEGGVEGEMRARMEARIKAGWIEDRDLMQWTQ